MSGAKLRRFPVCLFGPASVGTTPGTVAIGSVLMPK